MVSSNGEAIDDEALILEGLREESQLESSDQERLVNVGRRHRQLLLLEVLLNGRQKFTVLVGRRALFVVGRLYWRRE